MKGDSLDRQLKLSEEYALANGIELDQELSFRDLGLSAYSGDHQTQGALGAFLNMADSGEIASGSVLLIESLDRLSREKVFDAFNLFSRILKRGIKIVTLTDGMEYSEETLNTDYGKIFISLGGMVRAYDESRHKSIRLKSAWANKRKRIKQKPLTRICPAWLRYDNNGFSIIPERAELVKEIFHLYQTGMGADSIARQLNQRGISAWRSKHGWHKSYIQKILSNQAVYGEYQPHEKEGKKRIPVGPPIKNYYPELIPLSTFEKVKHQRQINKQIGGGKNGKYSNLFGGILRCAICGFPIQLIDKGKPPKGAKYLVCDRARRGLGCKPIYIRYDEYEESLLKYAKELDITKVMMPDNQVKGKIEDLNSQISTIEEELAQLSQRKENLITSLEERDPAETKEAIKNRITELLKYEKNKTSKLFNLKKQVNKYVNENSNFTKRLQTLQELIENSQSKGNLFDLNSRRRLRNEIRKTIKRIDLVSDAAAINGQKFETWRQWVISSLSNDYVSDLKREKALTESFFIETDSNSKLTQYVIKFRSGATQIVSEPGISPDKIRICLVAQQRS
jgi:DNA invertase Pin-like site-specific DNA recombinase